jgi:hypothetical protein
MATRGALSIARTGLAGLQGDSNGTQII